MEKESGRGRDNAGSRTKKGSGDRKVVSLVSEQTDYVQDFNIELDALLSKYNMLHPHDVSASLSSTWLAYHMGQFLEDPDE